MKDYQKSIKSILNEYSVDIEKGLDKEEVLKRKEKYGPNELREKEK